MRFLMALVLFFASQHAFGAMFCESRPIPQTGDRYIRSGVSLEAAKNTSRAACHTKHSRCEVFECVDLNPYAWTCVSANKCLTERKTGGYQAFGSSPAVLARYVSSRCNKYNRCGCVTACYPNKYRGSLEDSEGLLLEEEATDLENIFLND